MRIITTRQELVELAAELQVRPDWHEPDEQGLTARVEGVRFDNAGFWPTDQAVQSGLSSRSVELHVVLSRATVDGCYNCDTATAGEPEDVAAINLATLLAWATGHDA